MRSRVKVLQFSPTAPKVDRRFRGAKELTADTWVRQGMWVYVKSSNVNAIQYSWKDKKLRVKFGGMVKGSIYTYEGVDVRTAKNMFQCSSMGRYVHQVLKVRGFAYSHVTV